MESLHDRVKSFLNCQLTQTGEEALAAFLALPGVEKWDPENVWGLEVDRIFFFGLPFSIIGDIPSAHDHRVKVGKNIIGKSGLTPSDISEIHIAALLSHWCLKPTFVKTNRGKTPDLECQSRAGSFFDVEVVRADQRHEHKKLQDGLDNFAKALLPSDIGWNIACFMADASNDQELSDAFDAAARLAPGESAGVNRRWMVVAVSLADSPEFVTQAQLFEPEWWTKEDPAYWVNSVLLGLAGYPSIVVRSQVPLIKYVEPIKRKAERSQGRKERPFLIALDSTELPRAHDRIPPELDSFFSLWDHVSGILIFERRFWTGWEKKAYLCSVHPNPHAHIQLSEDLSRLAGEIQLEKFILSGT